MRPIHNRMPVVLDDPAPDDWINPTKADSLSPKGQLIPAPDEACLYSRHRRANSAKNDGPQLIIAT
jgi:putative SOS response-associated peptidase YedK